MKFFVTGASGFLGNFLCAELERRGHSLIRVNSQNCDLRVRGSLKQFDGEQFDQIIHLAAWTQAGDFCLYHPGEQWIINQQMNTNVLDWWHTAHPDAKLITIGTSCSYPIDHPLIEENYLLGEPIESLYTYGMTKRMLYIGQLALNKQFGHRFFTVVPSTLYGPGYHTDGRQMHFIFDLIRKILRGKLLGEIVTLWGDGTQKRELVFVEDFVRALLDLNEKIENDVINIGAGEEFSIREFARIICEYVDYDFQLIQFDTSRYVGAKSKCLDIKKLRNNLPGLAFTDLNEGLRRTIDWFRRQSALLSRAG